MPMTDVLMGQSYFLRFDPKLWEAMQPYPPLGTLYAASYLQHRGYEVGVFDSMLAVDEEAWTAELDRVRPRFAILYEDGFNYLSKMCLSRMRQAAFEMMKAARMRGCTVIVCGSDATDNIADYTEHGADYIVLGEGEVTLADLLDRLTGRSSTEISEIAGLAYRADDGATCRTIARSFIRDLDSLPFPAWDLVDVSRYREIWLRKHGYFSMNMVTTRGCPYHCNWCAKPIYGQRYAVRSPENVLAELQSLTQKFHPDHIWFADDIFGLKPSWIPRFAALIERENAAVPFKCLMRADMVKPVVASSLKRAGCQTVWIGAESGSQKILDAMEKGTRVEQIDEAARLLREAGIQTGFFLQFGYPDEDWSDIQATLAMVRRCAPDDIGVSVSYPLPGTKFYDMVKLQLGEQQNWIDSDDLAMLYRGPYPTEFYRALYRIVHMEFRSRMYFRDLRRSVRHPRQLRLHHARISAAALYHAARLPVERYRLKQRALRAAPRSMSLTPIEDS